MPLSYVEVSKDALISNLNIFKSLLPGREAICVIKANAYGHGIKEVVIALENENVDFQVDDIEELRVARKYTTKKILVLGYIQKSDLEEAIQLGAVLAIYDENTLIQIDKIAGKLKVKQPVELMVDTLMGREGFLASDIQRSINTINNCKNLILDGIYGHFSNIDDINDSHSYSQVHVFESTVKSFREAGMFPMLTHMSATAGILKESVNHSMSSFRLGIGLYGIWPSKDMQVLGEEKGLRLKSALRWVSHVAQVKELPSGYPIGYGSTYITEKPTKVALIPQGYFDGYDRKLSNKGNVLINGEKCRVLGRISMNMMTVDVSKLDKIYMEDEVILIGKQLNGSISAADIAEITQTIPYEIVSRISPMLPRISL